MSFGDRLKESRCRCGFTQKQLAEQIGVAKSTYTGYEKGSREPDLFKLKKLIEILQVDSSWLLGVEDTSLAISNSELELIKKYRSLDRRGQEAVDNVLEHEYRAAVAAEDNLLSKQA
ncbi:hypothetical protein B5F36_14925 [Anaerofilum sp. An201]|nr:helix-turn-helix transcriptional regulator [Anaerofilum sp. An201]OUO99805.1 hypothetical protein B5F36_14925 [Anaerofilum sp. An201]